MEEQFARPFTGWQVGAWYAPDITSDKVNGIGSWFKAELVGYICTVTLWFCWDAIVHLAAAWAFAEDWRHLISWSRLASTIPLAV